MAESEDFRAWCQTQGLTENTVQMLLDHGFTNQDTLRLVTQPIIDAELEMENLGQRLLLKEAIHKLWLTSSSANSIPGPASYMAPPAYDTLTHGDPPPAPGELFPLETLYSSNTRLPPLQDVHPPPKSMTFPSAQSISTVDLPTGTSTQPGQSATSQAQSNALKTSAKKIPAPKNAAKVEHATVPIDAKIVVATEKHPEKQPKKKTDVAEADTPKAQSAAKEKTAAPKMAAKAPVSKDDKIVVTMEQDPPKESGKKTNAQADTPKAQTAAKKTTASPKKAAKVGQAPVCEDDKIVIATEQPKKKAKFSYTNPYGKAMIDLTWLAIWFCFPLLGISIASAFNNTSTWKYFTGLWVFIIIAIAVFYGDKIKKLPAGNSVTETFFIVMSVLLHLALVACLVTMATSAYGMYIDREIHVNGTSCDDKLLKTLNLTCDHNATSNETYTGPNVIGWNDQQFFQTGNIALAYIVFVIVVWALYARRDFINELPPITFKNDTEKGFLKTSFMFKLTPISFPFLSIVEVVFKTTMWQLFLPLISGCILLITGFHAHKLHFLPKGDKKKKRYKVQLILLTVSMVVVLAMVSVHGAGIYLDNEIHEYGVSCDEVYIKYFNYTCEVEKSAGETGHTTHAYLNTGELNYKQGIHLGIVVLGVFHVIFLFIAINSGSVFMVQNDLKCC
ncbi:unnamed protein product [Owenia fusiformis]|uniref:Uncharacterized protein n=1 Tax=Owenia fusiformis TaxID=6347 RepID=A0A8J1TN29_OWEFU|nr:unnamed protein product [Owenia fusiformis]